MLLAGQTSPGCDLCSHTGPSAQKGPTLSLTLFCSHLEIPHDFLNKEAPHFNFSLGIANCVAWVLVVENCKAWVLDGLLKKGSSCRRLNRYSIDEGGTSQNSAKKSFCMYVWEPLSPLSDFSTYDLPGLRHRQ